MVSYKSLKVLVVDDFDSFRMTVSRMLAEFGCQQVDTAINGNDALKYCTEHDYDLILCDYNLGRGRNGLQVLEALRHAKRLARSTLFLLVSAESSRHIVLASSDYEPDGYLTKPITQQTLKQRLDRLLHQRQSMLRIYKALDDGDADAAIALCLDQLAAASRYSVVCQKLLGRLYLESGQLDLAEQVFRQVLEVRELDWAQVGMAQVVKARGQLDPAIEWLGKIIDQSPLCMAAYDELADCYRQKNDNDARQRILERAVAVSPVALLRQQTLAEVASENNDKVVAAQTYRRVVKLSENSVYEKIEDHLAFSRAAAAVYMEDEAFGRELLRDAITTLDQLEARFGKDPGRLVQTQLLESQLRSMQGNKKVATELYMAANQAMEESGLQDIDTELDRVMALQSLDQQAKAKELLRGLVEAFRDDEEALKKIDRLLDDPVSDTSRKEVARINKEGIGLYEKQAYLKAIECFQRAKRLFPRHVGVQLNLVQALVGQMRTGDASQEWMDLAQSCLRGVEKSINAAHAQYQRYRQLVDMVRAIELERKAELHRAQRG